MEQQTSVVSIVHFGWKRHQRMNVAFFRDWVTREPQCTLNFRFQVGGNWIYSIAFVIGKRDGNTSNSVYTPKTTWVVSRNNGTLEKQAYQAQ